REQREELVAHPEEGGAGHVAIHVGGLEEIGVERHRLLDVVDLQGDVVDSYEAWGHRPNNDRRSGFSPAPDAECGRPVPLARWPSPFLPLPPFRQRSSRLSPQWARST